MSYSDTFIKVVTRKLEAQMNQKIKRVGIDARKDIEKFVDKQVHLELYVKVDKDWRGSDKKLDKYGY